MFLKEEGVPHAGGKGVARHQKEPHMGKERRRDGTSLEGGEKRKLYRSGGKRPSQLQRQARDRVAPLGGRLIMKKGKLLDPTFGEGRKGTYFHELWTVTKKKRRDLWLTG